jgi:hypothetical protein
LEILERDGFLCWLCAHGNHLQIHHTQYFKGVEPWDYDSRFLVTLCSLCHATISGINLKNRKSGWEIIEELDFYEHTNDYYLEIRSILESRSPKFHPVMLPLLKSLADRMRFS